MSVLDFKIRDVYSGTLVRVRTAGELEEWLRSRYATLLPEQERCIVRLCATLEEGKDPKWWAAACGLQVDPVKKKRGAK